MKPTVHSTKSSPRHRGGKRQRQLELTFRTWGGSGRKGGRPRGARSIVPHRARPAHDQHHPVHVTLRARRVPSLRRQLIFLELRRALAKTWREWFRIVQFSVQTDHIHLVAEANDRVALSRGMAGVSIRLARAINRVIARKGNVFSDRYHARPLRTPREVRHAFVYVLLNFRKHLGRSAEVDPASSGFWFHGWKGPPESEPPGWTPDQDVPVQAPRTWLAKVGWRRHGLIAFHERPA